MKRILLGGAVATMLMMFAAPALAQGATGYMEICKASTGLAGTPTFTFAVSGLTSPVTVANNSCSAPFQVPAGTETVLERPGAWYTVSAISTDPGSALLSSNPKGSGALDPGPNGTAKVTVTASSDPSTATTVNYTNKPVDGYIEVCKNNASDSGLTGSWTFGIAGNNGFSSTTTVPIGHCSLPILVPAGSVTVTETPNTPTNVTSITVQNGAPSTTSASAGTATVTIKPAPAAGDTSQEAIVSFFNRTVQLKICKVAGDRGVTAPYTFTAVATGDPSFPSGVTRTVTVLPGQCQLLPGPYTNPNGTTGWRAGTKVTVSEAAVPGTAVTGITVSPANREVPGAETLTPLPDPANPAGSDAVILGSGETDISFLNSSEPGGTLKVCEAAGVGLPAGASFLFTISTSPAPTGSGTTALVPAGSCTLVPNPATSTGLWPFNSTVKITQVTPAGQPIVPPIMVSPAARELSASGSTVMVAIGSGDVTIATYTNDPTSGSTTTGAGSTGGGSTGSGSSRAGSSAGGSTQGSSSAARSLVLLKGAHLVRHHGRQYLALRVSSSSRHARIEIIELNKHGKMVKKFVVTVTTNKSLRLLLPANGKVHSARAMLMK